MRRGLHVSEYGILDDATGETKRCATEEEVCALLELPWIPPELRENRGELALRDGELPVLIEQGDLKGDLHMHTTLSDGRADAEAMALRGRPDVAIVDLREKSEREKHGVIPGSLHAPYPALPEHICTGGMLQELAAATIAASRPATVLPCAVATCASVLPLWSCVLSSSAVRPR